MSDALTRFVPLVLLPALAAGAVLALGWRVWRRDATLPAPAAWAALAVGVAAVLGAALRFGLAFPPSDSVSRLPWVAAAGAAFGALESAAPPRWRALLRWVLVTAALRFVLAYKFAAWGEGAGLARVAAAALLLVGLWLVWERAQPVLGSPLLATLLWLAASATSVMVLFAYNAKLAEHIGAACAGLGALICAALLRPGGGVGGALAVVLPLCAACIGLTALQGLADFPSWLLALPLAAPLGPLAARKIMQRRARLLGLALGLVPVAIGVVVAWRAYEPLDY